MKIAIYTSFAINYMAKARVLARTLKSVNPSIDIIGMICDRIPANISSADEPFDQIWTVDEYPAQPIKGWIFRHNIMELSTAVKGWGLMRLLDAGYDYVLYLDPDCWVLEDPAQIIDLLPKGKSAGVVPHTTRPADTSEEIRIIETSSLRHGIYNLGFLIVRNDEKGRTLAKWWADRLDKFCIDDFDNGLFTDQRWFDLAVGYFDFIEVIRHHGIDVASWNIGQRKIERNGSLYTINGDPLIFYHFSGVGPAAVHRWVRDKFAPSDPLASEMEFQYEKLILEQGQARLASIKPFYDSYSDGGSIPAAHRKLYRSRPDFLEQFPNPYDVSAPNNFRLHALGDASAVSTTDSVNLADVAKPALALFDPEFFRQRRGPATLTDAQAWDQFIAIGWSGQARFGNRFFDAGYYRSLVSAEERREYPTPFHHYISVGLRNGLSPNWIYDDRYYLSRYPDIADAVRAGAFGCGFEHFSKYGWREGRYGCAFFNEKRYLDRHQDVARAVELGGPSSGDEHYLQHGSAEGRAL